MKVFKRGTLAAGIFVLAVSMGYLALRWSVRSNVASTIREAERCLRRKENARARETLKWLLWFEPTQHRALLIQGISLNADRKFLEAIQVLERIPENSDSFEEAQFALASSLVHDEQLDRAESVLRRHLQRFPRSVAAREELVRVNIRLLRLREATALLSDFWKPGWDNFGALLLMLDLQVKPLSPQEAVSLLEGTNRKYPNQAKVVLALARGHALQGNTAEAQMQFEEALRLSPNDSLANFLAAEFFFDRGDVGFAQRLLNAESLKHWEDDRFWFLQCRVAEQSGQVQTAYAFLQKALERRPHDENYVLMQASLLRRLGRIEESRSAAISATQLAEVRKRLVVLASEFDRDRPSAELCLEIADHLQRWGQPEQADAWRRVSQLIQPVPTSSIMPSPAGCQFLAAQSRKESHDQRSPQEDCCPDDVRRDRDRGRLSELVWRVARPAEKRRAGADYVERTGGTSQPLHREISIFI